MSTELHGIEAALGHPFADRSLLERALTHASWAHEHGGEHNERLEFLGDAVLQTCTTLLVYDRFPDVREGALTAIRARLVNTTTLAEVAREIGLGAHLRLGRGEEATGGRERDSLLANVVEAVLGALFLEIGLDGCRAVVGRWLDERIAALEGGSEAWKNARNRLQELVQERWQVLPVFELIGSEGPDHARTFEVAVRLDDRVLGTGRGPTKREAAQRAAQAALDALADPPRDASAEGL